MTAADRESEKSNRDEKKPGIAQPESPAAWPPGGWRGSLPSFVVFSTLSTPVDKQDLACREPKNP
jgi:hypothetical protein